MATTLPYKKINYDYEVHPLAKLFPPLPPDEFGKLKKDIAAHGQQDPITLSMDGILLDGVNRLRACKELGIQPFVAIYDGDAADLIWAKNVLRRHLTADQRAAIAHKWSDAERAAAKERQQQNLKRGGKKPEVVNPSPRGKTRKAIAKKAQVSEHKVRQVEIVAKKAPELLRKVEIGEVKLKDAVATVAPKVNVTSTKELGTCKGLLTWNQTPGEKKLPADCLMMPGRAPETVREAKERIHAALALTPCSQEELEELIREAKSAERYLRIYIEELEDILNRLVSQN